VNHDDADLAAIRVLDQLLELEGIEFVSSRGVATLGPAAASFLLRHEDDPDRAAAFAAWLIDQVEVRDLYLDDEQIEELLRDLWDARTDRGSPPVVEAHRTDLEAMLRKEPDNLEHRLVYGDWLQGHRDPLGELITRQLAVASDPDNSVLEQAASSYLREHADALLGPLAEYVDTVVRLEWRGGFIESATLGKSRDDPEPYEGAILLRWLLEHRTAMLLRELELFPFEYFWGRDQLRALLAVVLERPRPLLRRLIVGIDDDTGELGQLTRLDELLPDLESLELRVRSVIIEQLSHPKLQRLVWHASIGQAQAAAFTTFELPRLASLELKWVVPQLGPILAKLDLPAMRSLKVPGNSDNLDWLVRVPWRAGLEQLDLSGGNLQDSNAQLLARLPWPRLRHLNVANNELGAEGVALLAALAPTVITNAQRPVEYTDEFEADENDDEDDDDDEFYESTME
jgi:uncharacterized protein (TIGR02996 family)